MRLLALSSLLLGPTLALCASSDNWKSRSIYQVLTDRFAMADGSSPSCDTSQRKYCGGTFSGIVNKLDYIQNMGFDAIWISPVVQNVEGDTGVGEAYHGYWTSNINNINSHFGSSDDLKRLSSALHDRGMYLMVDVVVNHLAAIPTNTSDVYPEPFDYSTLQPFGGQSSFHPQCFISEYNNQTDVEQCWLGTPGNPLIDLDTENSTNVDIMNNWVKNLVSEYSIDGLRIDTLKHVRKDFWPDFASSAGVYTVGEVLIDNTTYAAPYTQLISGILDYPTYFAVFNAFTSTSGNVSHIAEIAQQAQKQYKDPFASGSFIENHDQPRVQSETSDQALVKNAITWVFVNDGIPILYQGQEQGYQGGSDPANREALWLSGYNTDNKPLLTHVTKLNAARKAAISSNPNFLSTQATFHVQQSSTHGIAISKPPLLTLLTNGGEGDSSTVWTVPGNDNEGGGGFEGGQTLVDVFTCEEVNVKSDGSVEVTARNGEPMVLMVKEIGEGVCKGSGSGSSNGASGFMRMGMGMGMGVEVGVVVGVMGVLLGMVVI
ncbi:GH13 alpha-amylase precursor [Dendrothele bispora CBS 962.96]|uniref:alpha-amylase n=1 Tax=Dendrothele bispora (strain CBS 962.96) TaxID=1314807 RepID=A0A4S8M379_DENBC|nr:GH13 alpha-amylase precursor [Dendrothele bispora CBS 962.96]